MTFDEKLTQALGEMFEERVEQSLSDKSKHRFSLAYRLWERKTLRDLRRGRCNERWTLKKARYAVAAMITALSLLIGGTAFAAIALIGRYGFVNKVDYSKVLIEAHPSDKTAIEEYYGLPQEGEWELTDSYTGKSFTFLSYERGDIKISFTQEVIQAETMGNISTDRAKVEMVSLYEENDGFLLDFGKDGILLYWIYDGYLFKLSGNINKTKAINLAYSTKIIDF